MIVKSENKHTRNVWVVWLVVVGFVAADSLTGHDWAHFAGGVTGVVIFALIAYFTVGLPAFPRKGE